MILYRESSKFDETPAPILANTSAPGKFLYSYVTVAVKFYL